MEGSYPIKVGAIVVGPILGSTIGDIVGVLTG
jgi:uncharacterized membrane protein